MTEASNYKVVSKYDSIDGPFRVYTKDAVTVVIPETLAASLEAARMEYDGDAIPTQLKTDIQDTIFGVMRLLPNPALVKDVIVGTLQAETSQEILFSQPAAQVFETGRLILPDSLQLSEISKAVVNGWARLIWLTYEVETHFFRYAAMLEKAVKRQENSDSLAASAETDFELFALRTVREFFLADEVEFRNFITSMPLIAVTIARALERICDDDPSKSAKHMRHCIELVNLEALPLAQRQLLEIVSNPRAYASDGKLKPASAETIRADLLKGGLLDAVLLDAAFKLLLVLANSEQLSTLKLSDIDLSHEPHNPADLEKLGQITSLERLNLSRSMLSRESTGFLKALINLRQLDLSHTRIMSTSLNPLRGAPNLEELDISGTGINDSILAILPKIPALKRVNVTGTSLSNIEDLRAALPGCQVIG